MYNPPSKQGNIRMLIFTTFRHNYRYRLTEDKNIGGNFFEGVLRGLENKVWDEEFKVRNSILEDIKNVGNI